MIDIYPGDIVRHHDGTLARIVIPPTVDDPRFSVAFWLDESDVMEMAWRLEWCDGLWPAEAAPGSEWLPVQMELFDMGGVA